MEKRQELSFKALMSIFLVLMSCMQLARADYLIDQRYRDKNRIHPPPDQFYKTFYDKSYYLPGSQKPVYNVILFTFN